MMIDGVVVVMPLSIRLLTSSSLIAKKATQVKLVTKKAAPKKVSKKVVAKKAAPKKVAKKAGAKKVAKKTVAKKGKRSAKK